MASAQCSVDGNGVPNPSCGIAGVDSSSGMFVGSSNTGLTNIDISGFGRFKWAVEGNLLYPKDTNNNNNNHNELSFKFDDKNDDVSGRRVGSGYEITIGSQTNKTFLLNAGTNLLGSGLNIDFSNSQDFTYYLNAGGLKNSLNLSGGGNFIAYLTGGMTFIKNTGTNATFNFNGTQNITIDGSITAENGGTNHFNITGTSGGTTMEVTDEITATETNGRKSENNFTLNSTAGATNLTLKGATNQITTFTATGDANTLTIADTAKGANKIENLKLGDSTSGKAGLLTIENNADNSGTPVALTITKITANGKGSKLALNGAYDAIGTLTLTNGANLDLDASKVSQPLVVNTFTGSAGSELTISSGKLNITSQITTGNKVSNTFNIESGATLTLAGGFSTNGGGENKFFVKDNGTLTIEGIAGANNKLTTTGAGSVNHFDIAANAKVTNFYDQFETTDGGINRLFYAQDLELASITANGANSLNAINLVRKVTENERPTDHTLTLTGDITATSTGKHKNDKGQYISGNEVDAKVISMASNSIIADNGVNQILADESITLKNLTASNNGLNTLNLNGNPNGTITLKKMGAQSGGNNEIQQNGGILTLQAENSGGNTIAMSASGAGSKNYIKFGGNTLNITGNITTDQGGVNELDINALSLTGNISATGSADSKNIISLGAGNSSVSGNITEASGGQNLFTLDSTSGATSLILKGATNQITSLNVFGENANTLTLESTAINNTITNITLGAKATTGTATPAKNGTLTLNAQKALGITDLNVAHQSGTLNIDSNSQGKVTITTATLDGKTLTIDNASNQALVINTLTTSGTNTLNLNKGGVEITGKITAGSSVTNSFNIKSGATLTLTGGFETNGGGKNTFVIENQGTLNFGTGASQSTNLTTTGNGSVTEFDIKSGANFDLAGKNIIAEKGGANIITSDGAITLGDIEATGNGSSNTIKINSGELKLGQITSTDIGKNSFTIGDGGTGQASLTLDTSKAIATSGGGTTSFTIKKGSTLTLTGGTGSTLTANGANNEFIIDNGAKVNAGGGAGFYDTITATNSGKNIIKTSASFDLNKATANGGTNEITLRGTGNTTTMEITGAINGVGNNFTLDSNAKAGDKTNLTLKGGDAKTITNLTALSNDSISMNTLTIDQQATGKHTITNLVLGDSENGGKAGFLTIDNKATDNALTITNFEGKTAESKLTISKGAVEITNVLAGDKNNIALGKDTTLTLPNGGNLKSLETKTAGTNTINFAKGTTTITDGINAEASVINNFTLTNSSATFGGNISGGGANNFTLDSATLTLKGNINTIGTLKLTKGNNIIDLAGDKASRKNNEFKLLTIETNAPKSIKDTGLIGNDDGATLTFVSYINPKADQTTATLGGKKQNDSNNYGYAYSDRVIIHNAGDNQTGGTYKIAIYADPQSAEENIKYNGGGTEKEGNYALATIAKNKEGMIKLEASDTVQRDGFIVLRFKLFAEETDQHGKTTKENGADLTQKDYITYFAGRATARLHLALQEIIPSITFSSIDLWLAHFNSLNKRMGDLRENHHSQGVWARMFAGSQSNDFGVGGKTTYTTFQSGYDYNFGLDGANNYLGFALSYGAGETKYNRSSFDADADSELSIQNFESQAFEVALYNAYVQDEGFYNDTMTKFSLLWNKTQTQEIHKNGKPTTQNADIDTFAFTFSNEIGYQVRFGLDKEWSFTPQVELGIGYVNGAKEFAFRGFKDEVLKAKFDSLVLFRNRIGGSFGYEFKKLTETKDVRAGLYLGLFAESDYFLGGKMTYWGANLSKSVEPSYSGTRAVLNTGANFSFGDDAKVYVDFEKSFVGKIRTDYKVNMGLRYSFGEKLEFLANPNNQVKQEKAPLKIGE